MTLPIGTQVRRRKSFRIMVVLKVIGAAVTCGWFSKGVLIKQVFICDELLVVAYHSDIWPLT
ncbi:hypothetical protein [Pantoea sp. BAV 3049]|uniref:hypothetical protein n=1 Tax=Pantoea sp. BAV 3049 TaxID=2654188 RepID=UPI00131AA3E4|nr:hypothetical protein [Pantoea sp. BAV 3049]